MVKLTLHYCVENNEVKIAQLILEAEPGLLNKVDNEDYSALQLAVIAGNTPLINFFISEGADLASADKEGAYCGALGNRSVCKIQSSLLSIGRSQGVAYGAPP